MIRRFLRLLSTVSLPGWAFLVWAILAELHEVDFVLDLLEKLRATLEVHFFWTLALGLGWLFIVIVWPDLKQKLPSGLALRKTLHEKVHDIDTRLPLAEGKISFIESKWKYAKLDERLPELDRRIMLLASVVQSTGPFVLRLSEMTILVLQASRSAAGFERIRRRHPGSEVALRPFSKWRPLVGASLDESERDGLAWAAELEDHFKRCREFATNFKVVLTTEEASHKLDVCVATWYQSNISGEECLSLLTKHLANLEQIRERGVPGLAHATLGFKTIS